MEPVVLTKECTECGVTKPNANFYAQRGGRYGTKSTCDVCCRAYRIAWWNKNRDLGIQTNRKWKAKNRTSNRKYHTEYCSNRRKNDKQYKLAEMLRNRLRRAVKYKAIGGSAVQDLGISIRTLLVYLNLDCLDKYGEPYTGNEKKYHVDHITPLIKFDLTNESEVKNVVKWTNLQILSVADNIRKGGK